MHTHTHTHTHTQTHTYTHIHIYIYTNTHIQKTHACIMHAAKKKICIMVFKDILGSKVKRGILLKEYSQDLTCFSEHKTFEVRL